MDVFVPIFCLLFGIALGFWRGAVFGIKLVARANGGVEAIERAQERLKTRGLS